MLSDIVSLIAQETRGKAFHAWEWMKSYLGYSNESSRRGVYAYLPEPNISLCGTAHVSLEAAGDFNLGYSTRSAPCVHRIPRGAGL